MHVGSPSSGTVAAFNPSTQPYFVAPKHKNDADGDTDGSTSANSDAAKTAAASNASQKLNVVA